jgi:hypothetical protein
MPESWLDDESVLFARASSGARVDVWRPAPDGVPALLLEGAYLAEVSLDGRWVAYTSVDEFGTTQVYVRAYPELAGPWRVSANGGGSPRWGRRERTAAYELFYIAENSTVIMAVDLDTDGSALVPQRPRRVVETRIHSELPGGLHSDIHPDGRILVVESADSDASAPEGRGPITVKVNWLSGL